MKAQISHALIKSVAFFHELRAPARRAREGIAGPTSRGEFFRKLQSAGDVLELGPLDIPIVQGPNVAYFDVLTTEQLKAQAIEWGRSPEKCPHIDYVSPVGRLDVVDRKFDAIVSSHVIEHQPDLIRHLQDIEAVLVDGGEYYLAIPDMRYCFDHFGTLSRYADVVSAFEEQRSVHSPAVIRDYAARHTHNNSHNHWLGLHGKPPSSASDGPFDNIEELYQLAKDGKYVDVHCWLFTPKSFMDICAELIANRFTGLSIDIVHDTAVGELEFFAILKKKRAGH